jgi:hypothetical protein
MNEIRAIDPDLFDPIPVGGTPSSTLPRKKRRKQWRQWLRARGIVAIYVSRKKGE